MMVVGARPVEMVELYKGKDEDWEDTDGQNEGTEHQQLRLVLLKRYYQPHLSSPCLLDQRLLLALNPINKL